jgi:hypothetical protein
MKISTFARQGFSVILCLLLLVIPSYRAWADTPPTGNVACPKGMSQDDCDAVYLGWTAWVPDDNTCGTGTTTLMGGAKPEQVYNYFLSKGLTGQQAAGIMGNWSRESSMNPGAEQIKGSSWTDLSNGRNSAVGLAQWDGGRRPALIKYLQSKGETTDVMRSASDANMLNQLDYTWQELNGPYKDTALTQLQAAKTPSEAAFAFHKYYEISADSPDKIQNRLNDAEAFYRQYSGTSGSGSSAGVPTAIGGCASPVTGAFIEYKQCNYKGATVPWATAPYGTATVCESGCGPSAMAMIITNLTGQKVTPDMTALYAYQNGVAYLNGEGGSKWNIAEVVGSHWGLKSQELGTSITKINQALQNGALVLATGTGPNPFTSGGHFIVIRALTADGQWMTGNSAGYDSSKPYNPTSVAASMRNAWALTK